MSTRPSYAHGASGVPLLGETIGANLAATAARLPDHEALVDWPSGRRWTYAAARGVGRAGGARLARQGVKKGDRVGIWSPNCPEWVAVQYATALIGAILVNVNPAYRVRAGVRAAPGGRVGSSSAPPGTRPATTGPWWRRSAPNLPGADAK